MDGLLMQEVECNCHVTGGRDIGSAPFWCTYITLSANAYKKLGRCSIVRRNGLIGIPWHEWWLQN
jgi:hypothetical protein